MLAHARVPKQTQVLKFQTATTHLFVCQRHLTGIAFAAAVTMEAATLLLEGFVVVFV